MGKFVAAARMILVCTVIAVYLIIVGIPVLTYCRLISDPRLALRLTKVLVHIVLWVAGIHVQAEGLEKLDASRGYVYIANHRSLVDPAAAMEVLPGDLRFLIKKQIFHIPLVAFALTTMGMIKVDRSDSEAAKQSIDRAVGELQAGRSIILFPEGTRSRTGELLPFKKGAFVLALKAQAPLVPISFFGTAELLKPDTMQLYPGTVRMLIHDPLETEGYALDDRQLFLDKAYGILKGSV